MPTTREQLFDLARKLLITLTGNGTNRGQSVNDLHHKLSYRLHQQLPKFGITGEVKIELPGVPGKTLRMRAEDGGVAHQFLVYGAYEPYETELVNRLIKPGMTVYNIGANVGYYTIWASLRVGNLGKVFAFEPNATNFHLLEKNVADNGLKNVKLLNAAVAEKSGTVKLYLSKTNSGDHQIYPSGDARASEETEAIALKDFITENPAPDVIIMDVQGAELAVLRGFETYLTSSDRKPLVLFTEFSPAHLRKAGGSPEDLLALLNRANLELHLIDEAERTCLAIAPEELLSSTTGTKERNLLCLAPGSDELIADRTPR